MLAHHLEAARHEIVSEWMKAVQEDAQIPNADHLTLAALEDHFPEMLAELITALQEPATAGDSDNRRTGREHGGRRLRQGYRLDEALRELARVRELVLARVQRFCEERNLSALRTEAEKTIRCFFDTIIVASARQFMQEQEAEVLLRSRQLENAYERVRAATDQLRAVADSRLRLLRGVSHELRNALQSVNLLAEALRQESEAERRSSLFSELSGSANHLQRVLDRLQEFSNILGGEARLQLDSVDLGQFIEALDKTHRGAAERKGLDFRSGNPAKMAVITTDSDKLRHIADILLSNAIQCTERGFVEVTIRPDEDDRWIFRVADTGVGFDEASAKRVFHEFHGGTHASRRGVGLGLVIARHLAHLMDGEITFQSKRGEGSQFEVNLPIELRASQG
ncbi:MAG TPA: sensor histidine kinase [Chthoniobacteraceae bacterium]|jgi:signal transduction histidine kinase|nr:sensor histidine kinase [Chthoniobacteraceae bacterium]